MSTIKRQHSPWWKVLVLASGVSASSWVCGQDIDPFAPDIQTQEITPISPAPAPVSSAPGGDNTGRASVDQPAATPPVLRGPADSQPSTRPAAPPQPLTPGSRTIEIAQPLSPVSGRPQDKRIYRTERTRREMERIARESRIERQKEFLQSATTARNLAEQTDDVFSRGLLPLADYADQRNNVLEIRLSLASLQRDRTARIVALEDHAQAMHEAVDMYEKFNQPASAGWEADLAYVNLLAARADLAMAQARGEPDRIAAATALCEELAQKQFDLRKADYDFGLASISSYARAARELQQPDSNSPDPQRIGQNPEAFDQFVDTLQNLVDQVEVFREQDAGIGRQDQVALAKFELARAKGWQDWVQGKPEDTDADWQAALDSAEELFQIDREFFDKGTAHISDLIQSYRMQAQVLEQAQRLNRVPTETAYQELDAQMRELRELVTEMDDNRGRNQADITNLDAIATLQGLWERQRAQAAILQDAEQARASRANTTPQVKSFSGEALKSTPSETTTIIRGPREAQQLPGTPTIQRGRPESTIRRSNGTSVLELNQPAPEPPAPQP